MQHLQAQLVPIAEIVLHLEPRISRAISLHPPGHPTGQLMPSRCRTTTRPITHSTFHNLHNTFHNVTLNCQAHDQPLRQAPKPRACAKAQITSYPRLSSGRVNRVRVHIIGLPPKDMTR